MRGRPSSKPNLSTAGGRVAWCRHLVDPVISQEDLSSAIGYATQSGVGNLERRARISAERAKAAAIYLRAQTGYDTSLQNG